MLPHSRTKDPKPNAFLEITLAPFGSDGQSPQTPASQPKGYQQLGVKRWENYLPSFFPRPSCLDAPRLLLLPDDHIGGWLALRVGAARRHRRNLAVLRYNRPAGHHHIAGFL